MGFEEVIVALAAKTIVIDQEVEHAASAILHGMGITLDDAIGKFLSQIVSDRCLPFAMHQPNDDTVDAMTELDHGQGLPFSSLEALLAGARR